MTEIDLSTIDPLNVKPVPHRWAEVIKAWADGKEIQYRNTSRNKVPWTDATDCAESNIAPWNYNLGSYIEWRIKPETKTGWINIYQYENWIGVSDQTYSTQESANKNALADTKNVRRIACIQITYTEGEGLE